MTMKKLALLFMPLLFTSCAALLNEKIDAEHNLPQCFSAKISGVEVMYTYESSDITLTVDTTEDAVTLTASTGFVSYAWSMDGSALSGSENTLTLAADSLEGGWHLASVVACDADGNYFSAFAYFQVIAEKSSTETTVATNFSGADSESLSLSYTESGSTVLFTATSGFASYAWSVDGIGLSESSNTAAVDVSTLSAGSHVVTVIAKSTGGLYYSANASISKSGNLAPEIQCTGITAVFASDSTDAFAVTTLTSSLSVTLTATTGFDMYAWSVDGITVSESSNTLTVSLATLKAGWHTVTVTADAGSGAYYSASVQIQKTESAGSTSVQAGEISMGFSDAEAALSLTIETAGAVVTLTATTGFDTYAWSIDGSSVSESSNSLTVSLSALETGWHVVTAVATKDGLYYSSAMYIQITGD